MRYEDAIRDIKNRPITDFYQLERSKGGLYCCPICNSGKGAKGTGALQLYTNPHRVQCFAHNCFTDKGEDTPGALARIWNCSLSEVLERAGYRIDRTESAPAPQVKKEAPKPEPKREDQTAQYKTWHEALLNSEKARAFLLDRGIELETAKHFQLGYAEKWVHPTNKDKPNPFVEERIIIPRTKTTYTARALDRNASARYKSIGSALFNSSVLSSSAKTDPIIVVEGEIDAMLIWQLGHREVVALGSTSNKEAFVKAAKEKNPTGCYVLALDNDEAGREAQEKIAKELEDAGIVYVSEDAGDLYAGRKDAGESAVEDPDGLAKRIGDASERAYNIRVEREKAAELEAYQKSGAGMVDSFLQEIQKETFKPISSGISVIDAAIGGGFIRGSVIMLGSAPGMGKTALVSQICENIVRRTGEDILYLNLEMSREILLARSIARIANEGGKPVVTVNEILRGYEWEKKDGLKEIIYTAAEEYKETVANHLLYNPGKDTTDLTEILQKIEEEKRRLGHAPIVVLDYIQLVTGEDKEDSMAIIKRAMTTLSHYSKDNNTLVFAISANNRESMKTGLSGLNSSRDSSNIEYGADLHLGLEYEAVSTKAIIADSDSGEKTIKIQKGKDLDYINTVKREYALLQARDKATWTADDYLIEDAYKKYCVTFIIRVNKNRYLESERIAKLVFEGASARFLPLETRYEDYSAAYKNKLKQPEDLPF